MLKKLKNTASNLAIYADIPRGHVDASVPHPILCTWTRKRNSASSFDKRRYHTQAWQTQALAACDCGASGFNAGKRHRGSGHDTSEKSLKF